MNGTMATIQYFARSNLRATVRFASRPFPPRGYRAHTTHHLARCCPQTLLANTAIHPHRRTHPHPRPHVVASNQFASSGRKSDGNDDDDDDIHVLSSFANIDHNRYRRTGFPEAIFGEGKTPTQMHAILDSMATNALRHTKADGEGRGRSAIIATRVKRETYDAIIDMGPLSTPGARVVYHDVANIVSVRFDDDDDDDIVTNDETSNVVDGTTRNKSVVVACAGTTDLPVAEEAAITLSLSGVRVTRVYDCGVAGLHRILKALPVLRHPDVGCVIVCAGMDGALPSVVGGLVDVPVVAIPTSVGYGASLGGISALLTMLNSCSPGVGVVNIDNGFGGAVWAMKCLNNSRR